MTDYPAPRNRHVWRKQEIRQKWHNLLAVFIVTLLVLAIVNGLFKTISVKKSISNSQWFGGASFVSLVTTTPPSLFIYQEDPKRITFVSLARDAYFSTGNVDAPIRKVEEFANGASLQEFVSVMSLNFGISVKNYMVLAKEQDASREGFLKLFKDMASIVTPVAILTNGNKSIFKDTNFSRYDQFKLWWQIKGLSVNDIDFLELATNSSEIIDRDGGNVRGFDHDIVYEQLVKYVENRKISSQDVAVVIKNSSGKKQMAGFVSDMVSSVGFDVAEVQSGEDSVVKSQVLSTDKNSESTRYLANICGCDIFALPKTGESDTLTLVVGQDMAAMYIQ